MKKYFSLMKCGFLEGTAYRNSFLTSVLANFIQVAVFYFVWKSVFTHQPMVNGYTWEIMRKYVFVSFLCNSIFSFGFEMKTANRIIAGDIILDLLKPISYRSIVFYKAIGTAGFEFFLTLLFTTVMYCGVNGAFDMNLVNCTLFLISLLLGQGIKFSIEYFFSLICFYTDNAYGVLKGREIFTNFFSGALIPLAMFPPILKSIIHMLPFCGIVYIPCSIFIGVFSVRESIFYILFQVIWNVLLYIAGGIFWKKAISVISLYGG